MICVISVGRVHDADVVSTNFDWEKFYGVRKSFYISNNFFLCNEKFFEELDEREVRVDIVLTPSELVCHRWTSRQNEMLSK